MAKKYKFFALILVIINIIGCCSQVVHGYSRVDNQREGTLTVSFQSGNIVCEGLGFRLYRVASISDTAKFVLTEQFQGVAVSLQTLTQEEWKEFAQQLTNYILKVKSKIEPLAVQKTNNKGEVMFSDLPTGLYLVVGEGVEDGNTTISPVPFLVSLPSRNEEQEWQYHMNAIVKYTLHMEPEPLPSTGDNGGTFILFALLGSGIVLCFLVHFSKEHDI